VTRIDCDTINFEDVFDSDNDTRNSFYTVSLQLCSLTQHVHHVDVLELHWHLEYQTSPTVFLFVCREVSEHNCVGESCCFLCQIPNDVFITLELLQIFLSFQLFQLLHICVAWSSFLFQHAESIIAASRCSSSLFGSL
jgi:hypothetical protein